MKISILTFSKEDNYGANLQCYALLHTLKEMGHRVDIIDIQLSPLKMSLSSRILRLYQHYKFYKFRKKHLEIYYTKKYHSIEEIMSNPPQSDLYIVGSDQVWNPQITRRLDPLIYFFSFLPDDAKRVSYAASFGVESWNDDLLKPKVKKLLDKFTAVTVREKQGISICRDVFEVEASEVCDPTLLLPSYDAICGAYNSDRRTKELIYFKFIRNTATEEIIRDYAKKANLKFVRVGDFHLKQGSTIRPFASISRWLNNLRYSQMVITDSFHCMVFSIIFHRQFIAMPSMPNRSSRMLNFLNLLNLSDRYCADSNELRARIESLYNKEIDYNAVDIKIGELRSSARDFLRYISMQNHH